MAARRINVTQLTSACLDPVWRAAWLRGETPATREFPPAGEVVAYGSLFHRIAECFVGWLTDGRAARRAKALDSAEPLWHELYERYAAEPLTRLAETQPASALHLSQCLRAFCAQLAELRTRTADFSSWQDLYLGGEYPVPDIALPPGQTALRVSGRIDALRSHPEHGLEVVDYKLSHGDRTKQDLIQIAIYAKLLSLAKPGLKFTGTLEYYEPSLHRLQVSVADLEAIYDDLVEPVLAELSGTTPVVHATAPGTPAAPSDLAADSTTTPDLSDAIRDCFGAFNLEVEVADRRVAPQLVRYLVRPAAGVKVVSLANRAEDLQVALALETPPLIEPARGFVTIDVPKDRPDIVHWRAIMDLAAPALDGKPMAFPVGLGVDGEVMLADFADPNTCHALVAGSSGSGKSELLKSLAGSLVARNGADALRLSFIDPKFLTFGDFTGLPHLDGPVITDLTGSLRCLRKAVSEMEERYRQLAKEGFINLGQRRAAGELDIPYHVILFDEFADLVLAGKKDKDEFETLVARLAGKGRAAGIHLVLATQRPDRRIVTGPIKANLPLKICLRVTSAVNSQIVLDQGGGESLLGRGDLLCDRGRGVERAQSPYMTAADVRSLAGG